MSLAASLARTQQPSLSVMAGSAEDTKPTYGDCVDSFTAHWDNPRKPWPAGLLEVPGDTHMELGAALRNT